METRSVTYFTRFFIRKDETHLLMQSSLKHLHVQLDKFFAKGDAFNPKDTFTKLTITVIARCAFATEVKAFVEDDQHPHVKHLSSAIIPNMFRFLMFLFTPSFLRKKLQMHTSPPESSFNYTVSSKA